MNELLFVYGTLLPNRIPAALREATARLKSISPGSMSGRLYDLGDFPGAVFDAAASTRVHGEVFELPKDSQVLKQLDDYEDFFPANAESSLFVREKRPIVVADNTELPCWVYLYNREPGKARLVPSGDYSRWTAHQTSHS